MQNNSSSFGIRMSVAILAFAATANLGAAYLPSLGASPLRFAPAASATTLAAWPPLYPSNAAGRIAATALATAAKTNPPPAETVETTPEPASTSRLATAELSQTNLVFYGPPAPPPVMVDAATVVTPQQLMNFFRQLDGTNSTPPTAAGFLPPPPPAPIAPSVPSSTATYRQK